MGKARRGPDSAKATVGTRPSASVGAASVWGLRCPPLARSLLRALGPRWLVASGFCTLVPLRLQQLMSVPSWEPPTVPLPLWRPLGLVRHPGPSHAGRPAGPLPAGSQHTAAFVTIARFLSQVLWRQEPETRGDHPSKRNPHLDAVLLSLLGRLHQYGTHPPALKTRPRSLQVSSVSHVRTPGSE